MMLPFERFVRQVSNGVSASCHGHIGMMNKNAASIISTPWKRAVCDKDGVSLTVAQISRTDGVFDVESGAWSREPTYTAWFDDKYDAFAQGGDGVITAELMCGYLGCVAYRFTLPTKNKSALTKASIAVQRDRFLRAGVKISVEVSDRETPSDDWYGVIHPSSASNDVIYCTGSEQAESGTVGVSSWGFIGQKDVPYLTKSRAAMDVLEFDNNSVDARNLTAVKKYLYVYITLEDPSSYWEMYDESDKRLYNIEGSAMLVHSVCDFVFESDDSGFLDESGYAAIKRFYTMRDGFVSAMVPTLGKITDVSPHIFYSGCMSGFIALPDRLKLLSLSFEKCLKEMPKEFLHGVNDSGLDLSESTESDVGVIDQVMCWGNPKAFISIPSMEVFGGWPSDYNGESTRIMVLSKMCPNKNGDLKPQIASLAGSDSAVSAVRGYMQFVFGYAVVEAPAGKKSYSKIKITRKDVTDNNFAITVNLSVSLNVWHSKSMACVGMYSNMAIAALAKDPAMFTDGDMNISSQVTFPIMDYESHKAVENVSVSADASLISGGLSATLLASGEILVDGVDIEPSDMIIIAPRVDSISYVGVHKNGFAFFGAGTGDPEKSDEYTPQYNSGLELEVSFY